MADITLQNVSPEMLVRLGDEAVRAGDAALALGFFRAAWKASPKAGAASRIGLLKRPKPTTPKLFEALQALEGAGFNAFVGEGLATWNKSLPGIEDRRFRELEEKHSALLPLSNWHWNLLVATWAAEQARKLPGDFVELGVFRGHTTLFVAEYLGFADWPKRWRLYDTFSGIPADQLDPGWEANNETAYRDAYSYEEVSGRFAHIPNIEVIQGRVPEILRERPPGEIAFLHVDLNNATAEIAALDLLFEQVTPGGVVLFDDYGWLASRAQHEAERAWLRERGVPVLMLPTGQGLVVKPGA